MVSYSNFVYVACVSIPVFQNFDGMIFGKLSFPGTRRYVVNVQGRQMLRNQWIFWEPLRKKNPERTKTN